MRPDLVVRQCTDEDLAALEEVETPGSGITRYFLREQAEGNIVYASV